MRHKFRIWLPTCDSYMKRYYNSEVIGIHTVGVLNNLYSNPNTSHDTCIFEQWTGLTDINGIEIYEGDIIESETPHHGNHLIEEVVFQQGMFMAAGIEYALNDLNFIKVVGNINENPELLEEKQDD